MQDPNEKKDKTKKSFYLPPKVKLDDIHPNGKLLTDDQIKEVNDYFSKNPGNFGFIPLQEIFKNSNIKGEIIRYKKTLGKNSPDIFVVYEGAILGEGSFGSVKLMQGINSGKWKALKVMKDEKEEYPEKEHQNLTTAGYAIGEKLKAKDEDFIGMKLAKGMSIENFIDGNFHFSPEKLIRITGNILSDYQKRIADNNLIHQDIKTANIMIDPLTEKAKIVDLGLATKKDAEKIFIGTKIYFAPELAEYYLTSNDPTQRSYLLPFTEKSEVYALAVTIGKMLNLISFDPILLKTTKENWKRISSGEALKFSDNSKALDSELRTTILNYLRLCTDKDPNNRPTLAEMREFFKELESFQLNIFSKVKTIAIFDIDEYLAADPKEREQMQKALKQADMVKAVSNGTASSPERKTYMALFKELRQNGVAVESSIFYIAPGKDIGNQSWETELFNQFSAKNPTPENSYYFVTPSNTENKMLDNNKILILPTMKNASEKNYQAAIKKHQEKSIPQADTTKMKNFIIKDLELEKKRIAQKHGETSEIYLKRQEKIDDFVKKLQSDSTLNHDSLKEDLRQLQDDMYTGIFASLKAKFKLVINTNKSAKKVGDLVKIIEPVHKLEVK